MRFESIEAFLAGDKKALAKGPVALILAEDGTELEATVAHHHALGFKSIVLFCRPEIPLDDEAAAVVTRVDYDFTAPDPAPRIVNPVIEAAPAGTWMYYCFNSEFLFFAFCETRSVEEFLIFHTEERRDAMLTYVVDLYARDLRAHPDGVSIEQAHLDRAGYYALGRPDPENHGNPKERQLDFFGGLRWRFEEYIPERRRRIDRIAIFRTKPGLTLREDHTFSDEEYNTFACPWHHNMTAAICSFRAAKALRTNPGSRDAVTSFAWHNSEPFAWDSQQLMDMGLMEPGQWF